MRLRATTISRRFVGCGGVQTSFILAVFTLMITNPFLLSLYHLFLSHYVHFRNNYRLRVLQELIDSFDQITATVWHAQSYLRSLRYLTTLIRLFYHYHIHGFISLENIVSQNKMLPACCSYYFCFGALLLFKKSNNDLMIQYMGCIFDYFSQRGHHNNVVIISVSEYKLILSTSPQFIFHLRRSQFVQVSQFGSANSVECNYKCSKN